VLVSLGKNSHPFRIGGTLKYLLRGLFFESAKYFGHWKSYAFQNYLRRRDEVLSPRVKIQLSI
jgi:hypothetical protein